MSTIQDNNPLILIVDDVIENLKLLLNICQMEGYRVAVASNGKQAIETAIGKHPDLILLDIQMPEMDGFEVCEILKGTKSTKSIPVLFLTAKNETEDIVKGLDLGAVDFITKPFYKRELMARIKTHLELKFSREKIEENSKELLELNGQLKESQKKLLEMNATKDKFFSIIAHDLKNPFNALLNLSDFSYENFEDLDSDSIKENLQMMVQASNQGYSLLENLLEWSRSQTNRIQFNPQISNLNELIVNAFDTVQSQANAKNIALLSQIEGENLLYVDVNMINTVLRNLLSNGIKFTPINGYITVNAIDLGSYLQINVCDTGVGISPEIIETLFHTESMQSTHGTNNESGTGLGLILCKEFVERHKGKIWAESQIDIGSQFKFTLPKWK